MGAVRNQEAWAGARARLENEPNVTTSDLQSEARKRGADIHEASEIANQLAVERLTERYGGPGAEARLAALLSPAEIRHLTTNIDPFRQHVYGEPPADSVENRLKALVTSRRIGVAAQLKSDVAIVQQAERDDLPAHARLRLGMQAREASNRLEAISILLGIPRDALISATDERSVYPDRADALIGQIFGSYLPKETTLDRAQKRISVVSPEAFLQHYRAISGVKDGGVPAQLPMLQAQDALLVPLDNDRFGAGMIGSIALLEYAHAQGADHFPPLLLMALADWLALDLNQAFDPKGRAEVIDTGMTLGGSQVWAAISELIDRKAIVEGFFQNPAKLAGTLEQRFGSSILERLEDKVALCVSDFGHVLGASEVEALLRDQARLAKAGQDGSPIVDRAAMIHTAVQSIRAHRETALETIRLTLARAPDAERSAASTELARALGGKLLASLSDEAVAALAALPLRSEELYCLVEGPRVDFLERHDLGYAFRQLARQQGPVDQRGLELLQREVTRRSAAKLAQIEGQIDRIDDSTLKAFAKSLPALRAALGAHLQTDGMEALSRAGQLTKSDMIWADPSGAASEREFLISGSRLYFAEGASITSLLDAWLTSSASPALSQALSPEVAQHAIDEFNALHFDRLVPSGSFVLTGPVRSASPLTERIFRVLEEAVEAAVRRDLGKNAKLASIEHAFADRLARILFAGDVDGLRRAVDAKHGAGAFDQLREAAKETSA